MAEELARNSKHQKLRAKIHQAWTAQSCIGDLTRVEDICGVINRTLGKEIEHETHDDLIVQGALLGMGINLYARATSTSGQKGERGSIQLDQGKFTVEEWAHHLGLIDVRNRALAHVYSSQDFAEHSWHKDIVFAVEEASGRWKAAASSRQSSFQRETYDRLCRMTPLAKAFVIERFQRRIAAVSGALNEEKIPAAVFRKHGFDPIEIFGSAQAVAAVLDGVDQPDASFWVNR